MASDDASYFVGQTIYPDGGPQHPGLSAEQWKNRRLRCITPKLALITFGDNRKHEWENYFQEADRATPPGSD